MTFEQLLETWRKARHPSTSDLIERIGARIEVKVPKLPAKKGESAKALLTALKAEPATHRSARLAQLQTFAATTSTALVWPLFEALEGLPADPRIATLACRLMVGDIGTQGLISTKLLRRLLTCLEVHGDASHFELAHQGLPWNGLDEQLTARAQRVIGRGLAPRVESPELPPAERQRLLKLEWKPEEAVALADPLEAVYLAPQDRTRRQVLADVLLERGDPRGEFISLQLTGASVKRQQTLLKKHQAQWLGALADVIERNPGPLWVDGFVHTIRVSLELKRTQFLLVSDAPEWSTVERVVYGLQRLSPAMRALKRAGLVTHEVLRQWARDGFLLPQLEGATLSGEPALLADLLTALPQPLPSLEAHFPGWAPSRTLRNGLSALLSVPGLKRVKLGTNQEDVIPRLLREITLAWVPKGIEVLQFGDRERQLRLERSGAGWVARCFDVDAPHLDSNWKELLFALKDTAPMPVELHLTSPEQTADEEALRRRFAPHASRLELRHRIAGIPEWE